MIARKKYGCRLQRYITVHVTFKVIPQNSKIVAACLGMHVSPAKHSYACLPRKCYYWTRQMDGQTDAGQRDPYVPLCFAGDTKTVFVLSKRYVYISLGLPESLALLSMKFTPNSLHNLQIISPWQYTLSIQEAAHNVTLSTSRRRQQRDNTEVRTSSWYTCNYNPPWGQFVRTPPPEPQVNKS